MVVENHDPFIFLSCTPEILVIPYLQERGEPTSTSLRDARSFRPSLLGHRLLARLRCRVSLAVLMEENNTRCADPLSLVPQVSPKLRQTAIVAAGLSLLVPASDRSVYNAHFPPRVPGQESMRAGS